MYTICFVLLDTMRLYTERVPDVINAERAIMHVRRADPFPLSKPRDFEKGRIIWACAGALGRNRICRYAVS